MDWLALMSVVPGRGYWGLCLCVLLETCCLVQCVSTYGSVTLYCQSVSYSILCIKVKLSESELSSHYLVCLLVRLEDHNRTLRHKTHQGPKGILIIIPFTIMESLKIQINRGRNKEKTYQLSKR